jgi:predicted branched-subunit amino acid permease
MRYRLRFGAALTAANARSGVSTSATRYYDGVRAAAAVAVAIFGFGVSFGLLSRSARMGWLA